MKFKQPTTTLQKLVLAAVIVGSFVNGAAAAEPAAPEALTPGLLATFRDDLGAASEVVQLPELGLAADESPHPAIKPAFSASFDGFIQVTQTGRYLFDTKGALTIDGELVTGERALEAGQHALHLTYQRPPGELRFGLTWQSDLFTKEPVPPSALSHAANPAAPTPYPKDGHPSPPHRIREAFASMKCASCHDPVFLGTLHHKYKPEALLALMRHANPPKWYGALTGPLLAENETLTRLAADLRKLPGGEPRRSKPDANPNDARLMVGTQKGLACIACHDFINHKTEAETKGPNLVNVTERVTYDWFVRWMNNPGRLKPGVPMPAFFAGLDPAERQAKIDALWDYFSKGERMELPGELRINPKQFVLKPTDQPLYTRTYIRLPNGRELLRAICVGLPTGLSYCFDAETCQLAYVWKGGFLDMAPHWQNQSGSPTPAIGNPFYLPTADERLSIGDLKPRFLGYELVGGIPRFEFAFGATVVRLLIDAPTPERVTQTFSIGKRAQPIVVVGPPKESPVSTSSSHGTWTESRLTIDNAEALELVLTTEPKK